MPDPQALIEAPSFPLAKAGLDRQIASWLDWFGSRKTKTMLVTILTTVLLPQLGVAKWVGELVAYVGLGGVAGQAVADIKTGGSRR